MINRRRYLGEHARGVSETAERRSSVRGHVVQRHVWPFDTPLLPPLLPFDIKTPLLHYLRILGPFLIQIWWLESGIVMGRVLVGFSAGACAVALLLLISFFILQASAFYKTQKRREGHEIRPSTPHAAAAAIPRLVLRIAAAVDC